MPDPHRAQVLARYRELLQLIKRLPPESAASALAEAQQTIRQRSTVADPETQLLHLKELVAKISFLRITTPRPVGERIRAGTFVLRGGELVPGTGEEKGSRSASQCCPVPGHTPDVHMIDQLAACSPSSANPLHGIEIGERQQHMQIVHLFVVLLAKFEIMIGYRCMCAVCRVADGSISMDEAQRLNRDHYKRFFGKDRPKDMFF